MGRIITLRANKILKEFLHTLAECAKGASYAIHN